MYESSEPPLPTRVVAGTALLRAGLERAARSAGLTPVASTEHAVIELRCDDDRDAETGAPVDVRAAVDRVTVTIARDPGPRAWAALQALTRELLGSHPGHSS